MDSGWDDLMQTLRNESEALTELIALGKHKRQAIQELDLTGLQETNSREEVKVLQLRELGETRRVILERLLPVEGDPQAGRSLREAIGLMPVPLQEAARGLRQKLLDQVRDLGQITQGNAELLRQSVERVDGLVRILLGSGAGEPTYQVPGRKPAKMGAAVMDREV